MRSLILIPMLALLASSLPAQKPTDSEKDAPRQFMRFLENDEGGFLQVLVATYKSGDRTLKLYGCVHVAERSFYEGMQKNFEKHDALLYELIADPDVRPFPEMETGGEHWLSMVQDGMGSGLALQGQFACMDYRMKNFVHADMTEDEWADALDEAGKSEFGELMSNPFVEPDREAEAKQKPIDLVEAFRNGQGISQLRIMMGRVLVSPEAVPDQPTVIIHGRNEKCLAVLKQQLDSGKKNLGIFYGAAHMEHMEQRLLKDLGWKRVTEEWVSAWDCRHSSFPTVEKGLKRKRYRARRDVVKLTKAVTVWCEAHEGELPSWEKLRAGAAGGKLPGRADGKDPWGRDYVLVPIDGGYEVRSTASDGKLGTEDDVVDAERVKESSLLSR
ncbi:MAG: hypothetical protein ACI89X_003238 [Planctomycetota bacterium]|jgi:hypothetical protein